MAALSSPFNTPPGSPVRHLPRALPREGLQIKRGLLFDGQISHPRPHKADAYVIIERDEQNAPRSSNAVRSPLFARKARTQTNRRTIRKQRRQSWADEQIFTGDDSLVDIIGNESGVEVTERASPARKTRRILHKRQSDHIAARTNENQPIDTVDSEPPSEDELPYGDAVLSGRDFLEKHDIVKRRLKPAKAPLKPVVSSSGSAYSQAMSASGLASASGIPSASGLGSASASASASAPLVSGSAVVGPPSKWVDGAQGLIYSHLHNGTSTVITSASNVYVVQGGGDSSNGDPLLAQIMTQNNETVPSSLFWLIDETGDFCTNNATNMCYITLGDGYNDQPFSLVPYDLSANNDIAPLPIWSINGTSGKLSATYANNTKIQFVQNTNAEGNGDVDAIEFGDTPANGFARALLFLK